MGGRGWIGYDDKGVGAMSEYPNHHLEILVCYPIAYFIPLLW